MQLTTDWGICVYLVVIFLAFATASEHQKVLTSDRVSSSGRPSGAGRSKPRRPNDTLGKGSGATKPRRQPVRDISEPTAYRHDSSHCKNGGTGFLRSFCFCTEEYKGRYCEDRVNSSCDTVNHGDWVYRNCSVCQCVDGVLECRRHELEGCRKEPDTSKYHSHQDGVALEMQPHSNGCILQGSLLTPLMALLVYFHRILWLQNTSVR
ncbi:teratocarcinoma-derived growth factor-like isoform X2 [Acanthaster planci]|uniref:Teratocarcinoma-derived growth factor-like isoform X2 n=1 Tax=Acanthaster planci TaxID=133434 RepID=A0A8B7YXP0_ACAPL|nr:teratocarcinoma-derived growth factor-like isoform X2 [Acanthaster planci]